MAKRKRCKVCNKLFTPQYTALQQTCNYECAIAYSKLKAAQNKAELNKIRNEKVNTDRLQEAIDQTRVIVNSYIRLRDQGKPCISCMTILGSDFDAGHIYSVKQHNRIRFDYDVIYGQCRKCNRFEEGNYDFARARVRVLVGDEQWEKIEKKAELARVVPHTWTRHELREIRDKTRALIRELKFKRKS